MPLETIYGDFYAPQTESPLNVTCANLNTTLNSLQNLAEAVEDNLGGFAVEVFEKTSGNNHAAIGYVETGGTPVVDMVWAGVGSTSPSATITVTGGTIRILDLYHTYENTNGAACNLDIIIVGVGAVERRALPVFNKVYDNASLSDASPTANLYIDMDNTPQLRPYGYLSASMGTLKVYVPNIPAAERHAVNAIWKLS